MRYILLAVCLTLATFSKAGNDTKILKQAAGFVAKSEFNQAAKTLEKISVAAQTSPEYLQAAALVYDSLKQYNKAIGFYAQLGKNDAIKSRITFLKTELAAYEEAERIRLEKMKNCTKCQGTGVLHEQAICNYCGGQKMVTKQCSRCRGEARIRCSGCRGTGTIEISVDGRISYAQCSTCHGKGSFPCNSCTQGSVTEECSRCNASGVIMVSKPCDMH